MDKKTQISNEELIERIRKGDERALTPVYEANRKPFIRWAIWYFKCEEYDAADVYQKAFSIFYFNIKDGKLETLTSKVETYLFGIGKRLFMEKMREKQKQGVALDDVPEVSQLDTSYFDEEAHSQRQHVIGTMLKRLGEPCSVVLKLYYYNQFSMDSIADELGYKNEFVAKKKKYECLQKLKKIAEAGNYSEDDLLSQ